MQAGATRQRAQIRPGPGRLEELLHQASCGLIQSPHHGLITAMENTLAGVGVALEADRVIAATREAGIVTEHYFWERRARNGNLRRAADDSLDPLLGQIEIERTLTFSDRKEFMRATHGELRLPARVASGILVPFPIRGRTTGVLAVTSNAPREWDRDAVRTAGRLADLLSAGLDRLASLSSLAREQDKRLKAEAEMRRLREQLAHAGRVSMLGELAASLAHELNQPLTAIYTNAQAANRFLDRRTPALGEARRSLHDLGQDCRRAGDVLGRLRQMFRRHETERVPQAVGPLIERVLKLLHEDAVTRDVNLVIDIGNDLPMVNGDRVQLEQVVMNLVVNAFDAVTGSNGPREVTVRATRAAGSVSIAVIDTGNGIARSDLPQIFEPFFTRKPNGMGIGLAICRTIVEAHGGRISARNGSEHGSIFELSLSAIPPARANQGGTP